jgi:hypothetical protein
MPMDRLEPSLGQFGSRSYRGRLVRSESQIEDLDFKKG